MLMANSACFDARHDDAPATGDPTDYTNSRWPSYTGWADFCDAYGLRQLILGKLMHEHPGYHALTREDLKTIRAAAKNEPQGRDTAAEYNRARMKWLLYWVKWALSNCKQPAIYNS